MNAFKAVRCATNLLLFEAFARCFGELSHSFFRQTNRKKLSLLGDLTLQPSFGMRFEGRVRPQGQETFASRITGAGLGSSFVTLIFLRTKAYVEHLVQTQQVIYLSSKGAYTVCL